MTAFLFLDTNIFLHYRRFDEIEWKNYTGTDQIHIYVVAPIVIQELDSQKNTGKKISRRAKAMLSKIEDMSDRYDESILILHSKPTEDVFQAYQLNKSYQDDLLLASILQFKATHLEDEVILVTADTGPRLKAKSLNIKCVALSLDLLLPTEEDQKDIYIRKLTEENNRYKNRQPNVKLFFSGKRAIVVDKFHWDKSEILENNRREFEKIKKEYPYKQKEVKTKDSGFTLYLGDLFKPTEGQIDEYNHDLTLYHKEYEDYLSSLLLYSEYQALTVDLGFELWNDGNAVADQISVFIHLPDGFEVIEKENYPKIRMCPSPPQLHDPLSVLSRPINYYPIINTYNDKVLAAIKSIKPTIRKTNSYEITMNYPSLNHHQKIDFPLITIQFKSFEARKTFQIDFCLTVGNQPELINGQLTVKLT